MKEWSKLKMVHLVSVYFEFIFCGSGTLGLELTSTPETAMVLGSKLAWPVFSFQTGSIPFQNRLSAY